MNPSSWNNQPSGERQYERSAHRSATAPVSGYPAHPRALMPGYVPQTLNRPDLFFANASRMTIAHDVRHSHFSPPPPIPPSNPSYYYNTSQTQHLQRPPPPVPPFPPSNGVPTHPGIYFRRSLTSPPPVPPKPSPPQNLPPSSTYDSGQVLPTGSTPPDPSDENDLAMALALSQSVSNQEQKLRDKLTSQEEDDLARALEESLQLSEKSKHFVRDDVMEGPSSISLDAYPNSLPPSDFCDDDEALARMLAMEQEQESQSTRNTITTPSSSEVPNATADLPRYEANNRGVTTPVSGSSQTLLSDEALAQKLALEDGDYDQGSPRPTSPVRHSSEPPLPGYPQRDEQRSNPHYPNNTTDPTNPTNHHSTPSPIPDLPAYAETFTPSSPNTSPPHLPDVAARTTRSNSSEADVTSISDQPPRTPTPNASSDDHHSNSGHLRPSNVLTRISSMPSLSDTFDTDTMNTPSTSPSISGVNQFVDKELFIGVSIGFMAPKITTQLFAMQDAMPNIISLPFGRCPPLHLQGPNWRHILKLMARLSGTKVEPTVEALAITKTDLRLRTVVQLVRPHPASTDWRTILYFTLDYPPPRNVYVKNGVNDLPYSYSLSTIPTLLRDSADTLLSKTYTIPASDAVPYPKLPINFPSLAMYLQAALEESRRYINDSSSGNRKLAKMIQACYRSDEPVPERDSPERSGVGGLFKRVIGRKAAPVKRSGNEDTYELVTPFVPDEWG